MQPTPTLRLFIAIFLSISATNSFSQDTTSFKNLHEVYLSTDYILNPRFSLKYKKSKKGKTILKIGLVTFNSNYFERIPNDANSYPSNSLGLATKIEIGIEKRKILSKTCTLFIGPGLILGYTENSSSREDPNLSEEQRSTFRNLFNCGVNYTLGCMVLLHKNCLLAGEIFPELGISYSKGKNFNSGNYDDTTYSFYFDANSYPLTISFIYRF